MDLTDIRTIKILLEKYKTKPIKGLGQNFLVNKDSLKKMISYVKQQDNIIEIGPGIGSLTKELSNISKKVIAIEKDRKMIEILKETAKDYNNIEIIHSDILKIENCKLKIENYDVVANLPYYISTAVIRKFLELENHPKEMILTIQKEVAQRICSSPPDMNLLAVSVQFYAIPKILFNISKSSFFPQPKVNSSVIKITSHNYCYDKKFCDRFFKVVKAGFSRPRAQLLNNLSKKLKLEKEEIKQKLILSEIKPEQRAETLDVGKWITLTKNLK